MTTLYTGDMSRVPSFHRQVRRFGALSAAVTALALALTVSPHALDRVAAEEELPEAPLPELTISPNAAVLDPLSESFEFTVLLRQPGEQPLAGGTVVVSIDSVAVQQVADFDSSKEDRNPLEIATLEAPATPAVSQQVLALSVPRPEMPLSFTREPGVYLLRAEFFANPVEADETGETGSKSADVDGAPNGSADTVVDAEAEVFAPLIQSATPIVWGGVDAPPVPITLVVPLVLPTSVLGVPDSAELAAVAPALADLLTAAEAHEATLGLDPRVLVGTRGLGAAAPASARELVQRLEETESPIFLLQFADADPAVQAALGFEQLLEPTGFDYITQLGRFDDAVVPTIEELLALPNARSAAWPATSEADQATLKLLEAQEIGGLVLDAGNVTGATGTRVSVAGFDALIADTELGEAARAALTGVSATERNAGLSALASRLAFNATLESPGAVLALDRGALADSADPLRIFEVLAELSWVQATPESLQPEGTAKLRSGTSIEMRRELLRASLQRSDQIYELSVLLENPEYLTQYQRVRELESLATRYAEPGVDFMAVDELAKQRDAELLSGVQPVTTENMQLVSTSSQVPVTLRNSLPFDALVLLHTTPISAAISIAEPNIEARVPAHGSSNTLLPVRSRLSSGETGVLLEVRSLADDRTFASSLQVLSLRTAVEATLLMVLSVTAAALFGFGIWRSVRRKRLGLNTGAITLPVTEPDESSAAPRE